MCIVSNILIMTILWLVILGLVPAVIASSNERPIIETPSGKYRGHVVKSRNSRDVFAFQGIPYALPPTGSLRLKDPVKMPPLEGIYEANIESGNCYQPSLDFNQVKNISAYTGSEDCLYLNVYKPKKDEKELLPVYVFVHGGAFVMGSASSLWIGPAYLMDKDMIFVSMNYRLGILGFLSTGDSILPGNFGMKDQTLALKWVQENIEAFGGDPTMVTLGGASAGGSSVSLHMHSPLSKGLFHRAIAQSGTVHSSFATKTKDQAKADALKVASYLGCSEDPEQLLKCLQKMPIHKIAEAATAPIIPSMVEFSFDFVPVIEDESTGAFLTQSSLNEASEIPLLSGVTSHECLYFLKGILLEDSKYYEGDKLITFDGIDEVISHWGYYRGHPKEKEITQTIMKFYFGENGIEDATEIKLIDIFSDLLFNYGLHLVGKLEKGPKYLYKFSYKGAMLNFLPEGLVQPEGLKGSASHGEDCMFLFDSQLFLIDENSWSEKDSEMSNLMIDIWYNFMKTGDPTPDSKQWKESDGGVNYLEFTNQGLRMESNMFQSRMEFLDKLNIDRSLIRHDEL